MNDSRKFQIKTQMAKAVGAALLTAVSFTAQAGLIAAGNTRPGLIDPNLGFPNGADGTVFYAVYQKDSASLTDPWGTGGLNLAARAAPGDYGGSTPHAANLGLDVTAQYLYVYMTYNNEPIGLNDALTKNGISVSPALVSSWGAFQNADGPSVGNNGTALIFSPDYSAGGCGFGPAGNIAPIHPCVVSGPGAIAVTIAVDPNVASPLFTPTTLNGLPTYSPVHTFTKFGPPGSSSIRLEQTNLAGRFLPPVDGGSGPLFGEVGTFNDGYQFSTVFYMTSNTPARLANATLADGVVSNGTVLAPGIAVPEPMMLALLGSGLLLLGWSRRTK